MYINEQTRNADITGVKYSKHKAGAKRQTEAASDDQTRVTMIVKGGPMETADVARESSS